MEVKIGIHNASRELVVDTDQATGDVEKAIASGREAGLFTLTDTKGRVIVVPFDKLAYVEIGSPTAGQVGFRS